MKYYNTISDNFLVVYLNYWLLKIIVPRREKCKMNRKLNV